MPRYIDVEARIAEIQKNYCTGCENYGGIKCRCCWVDDAIGLFDDAPTVDAKPVVHGRWITHNRGQNNWCECSECNTVGSPFWKRCPVCEAKMDGDGNG